MAQNQSAEAAAAGRAGRWLRGLRGGSAAGPASEPQRLFGQAPVGAQNELTPLCWERGTRGWLQVAAAPVPRAGAVGGSERGGSSSFALVTFISLLVCLAEPEEPVDPRFLPPVVPSHGSALTDDLNIFMTLST